MVILQNVILSQTIDLNVSNSIKTVIDSEAMTLEIADRKKADADLQANIDAIATDSSLATKVNTLYGIHFPTTMTVSDNGSTAELDKMKIVVYDSATKTYPTTNITGVKTVTGYDGVSTTTNLSGVTGTYEGAITNGKSVYTFTDSISGKNGSITYHHCLPCYLWFSKTNTVTAVDENATVFTPTSISGISKSYTANLDADYYIYISVPSGWSVSSVTIKSNIASSSYEMTKVGDIYVSTKTVKNINGNTITAVGSGSIA